MESVAPLEQVRPEPRAAGERLLLAFAFTALGLLIIVVFSPWRRLLPVPWDYAGRLATLAALGGVAAWLRRRASPYASLALGLWTLLLAVTVDRIAAVYLLTTAGVSDAVPAGWAILKVNEALLVTAVVVGVTLAAGQPLRSLYLQRGDLRRGLTVGLIALAVMLAGGIPTAGLLFGAPGLTVDRALPWLPWLLPYVLANGFMEELMFRGLFLRRLAPFMRPFMANLLVAVVFALLHRGVTYTTGQAMFLALTFGLALVWGHLMQRTDSLWGSALFHAAMDIPVMLGIFANL